MNRVMLGKSGIGIAPLALGTNVFGWTADPATSFRILDAYVDAGLNLVDTADVYSKWAPGNHGGESETIIGKWLAQGGKRGQLVIATKCGKEMGPGRKGLSQKYIREAVESSLLRLQTDYIDLYQSHDDDPETPMEETMMAFADLVREGKVRAIGASNFTAARLQESMDISNRLNIPCYETLQPLYNLYEREQFEKDLEGFCVEKELGVLPYYSLARGFLTGKYRSEQDIGKSPRGTGAKKYLTDRGFRILQTLDEIASHYNSSPAAVSLAWLMARRSVTAPIVSATSPDQLSMILESVELTLSRETIEQLNHASEY